MNSNMLQELVQNISNETKYLIVNQDSLPYYVASFLSIRQSNRESGSIIEYVSYEINIENLPTLYKKDIKGLISSFKLSPLSFHSYNFSFKSGFFYNCSPKKYKNEYEMFQWLRERNYPHISTLEMKWPFLTDEFKQNEYFKVYQYAQEEFIEEVKKIELTLNQFKEETNNLLLQLYKLERKALLVEV